MFRARGYGTLTRRFSRRPSRVAMLDYVFGVAGSALINESVIDGMPSYLLKQHHIHRNSDILGST